MENRKIYFRDGDEVAHKDNIELRMEVRRILRTRKEDDNGVKKSYTIGIECGWWDGENYCKEKFHTAKLVPWDIAAEGYISVIKWIEQRNKIKA